VVKRTSHGGVIAKGTGMTLHNLIKAATILALFYTLPTSAQEDTAKKFAGTWEAQFNGAVFSVLKIQANGKITGSLSAGNIEVDIEGNLRSAAATEDEFPILGARIENDSLIFEWNDDDPNDPPLKFELKLMGEQKALLHFLTTPNDAKIKPFALVRRS
jgi:hypothetical protein